MKLQARVRKKVRDKGKKKETERGRENRLERDMSSGKIMPIFYMKYQII